MSTEATKPTVTVDGTVYELDSLSPQVRNLIALYQKWSMQLSDQQSELTKTDLAVKSLGNEITKLVNSETAQPKVETESVEEKPVSKKKK